MKLASVTTNARIWLNNPVLAHPLRTAVAAAGRRRFEDSIGIVVALAITVLWPERPVHPQETPATGVTKTKKAAAPGKAF